MEGLRKGREKHERGSTTELRESLHISPCGSNEQ